MTSAIIEKVTSIPSEPDQTRYERDTLIWMLIDITGEPKADLFTEAVAEIEKLKHLRDRLSGKEQLVESLRSEEWQARLLLSELVSTEACQLDYHGYCQAHGWMRTEPTCPHGRAEALLRKGHRHPA